jgi:hypothetical protein
MTKGFKLELTNQFIELFINTVIIIIIIQIKKVNEIKQHKKTTKSSQKVP